MYLPKNIEHRIYSFLDNLTLNKFIKVTYTEAKEFVETNLNVIKDNINEFIKLNPDLHELDKQHLNSRISMECISQKIHSVSSLLAQRDNSILNEFYKLCENKYYFRPIIKLNFNHLLTKVEPKDLEIQDFFDAYNQYKMLLIPNEFNKSNPVKFNSFNGLDLFSIIMPLDLAIFGILSGLSLDKVRSKNFNWHILELINKGFSWEQVSHLEEYQAAALLTGEPMEVISNPDTCPASLDLCKVGIPLAESSKFDSGVNKIFLRIICLDITSYKPIYSKPWLKIYNEYAVKIKQEIENIEKNIKENGELNCLPLAEEIFKNILCALHDVPASLSKQNWFTQGHAFMIHAGKSLEQIRKYTREESIAISLNFSEEEAVFSNKRFEYDEPLKSKIQISMRSRIDKSNPYESDIYKDIFNLNSPQIISKYFANQEINQHIYPHHVLSVALLHEDCPRISDLTDVEFIATTFGLSTANVEQPWLSVNHLEYFFSNSLEYLEEDTKSSYKVNIVKVQDLYSQSSNLNGTQLELKKIGISEALYKKEFFPSDIVTVFEKTEYKIEELLGLSSIQLNGISSGMTISEVKANRPTLAQICSLILFPNIVGPSDVIQGNLDNISNRYCVPDTIRNSKYFSWEHIIAYVRGIDIKKLSYVTSIQALGLSIGISLDDLIFPNLSYLHFLLLHPTENGLYNYHISEIKNFDKFQAFALLEGFSIDDVSSSWFTKYHYLAYDLGMNIISIKGASTTKVKQMINDCYDSPLDFEKIFREDWERYNIELVKNDYSLFSSLNAFKMHKKINEKSDEDSITSCFSHNLTI